MRHFVYVFVLVLFTAAVAMAAPTMTFTPTLSPTVTVSSTFTPTPNPLNCDIFGDAEIGPTGIGAGSYCYFVIYEEFPLAYNSVIQGLHVYVDGTGGGGLAMAIYQGGVKKTETVSQPAVMGWNAFVVSPFYLAAGNYQLAVRVACDTGLRIRSGPSMCLNAVITGPTFPDTIGGACGTTGIAIYADYCPSGSPTVTPTMTVTLTPIPGLDEALDVPGFPIGLSGSSNWFWTNLTSTSGGDSAQSGPITDNQSTDFYIDVTAPAVITFDWKVSSEGSYDYLYFRNSTDFFQTAISGEVPWTPVNYVVAGSGLKRLRWWYAKDGATSSGQDAAWVDYLVIIPGTPTFTPSLTQSGTPTATASPSSTPAATQSPIYTMTPPFSATMSPSFTRTPLITATTTPTSSVTVSPTLSRSPSVSPSMTQSRTSSPTLTMTVTPTISSTFSVSPTFTISSTPGSVGLQPGQPDSGAPKVEKVVVIPVPVTGPSAKVSFYVEGGGTGVEARIYDTAFSLVTTVVEQKTFGSGWSSLALDTQALSNGTYYVKIVVHAPGGDAHRSKAIYVAK